MKNDSERRPRLLPYYHINMIILIINKYQLQVKIITSHNHNNFI